MATKLVLVANRAGASLYEHLGLKSGLKLLRTIPHPEGRLKEGEINSDRHGYARVTSSGPRSSYSAEESATERMARGFASELADILEEEAYNRYYDRLFIAAEPRFLGMIKSALGPNAANRLAATLPKDLSSAEQSELAKQLQDVL